MSTPAERTYAYVWDGVLLYAPRELRTSRHAHFAATLLIASDTPFTLRLERGGAVQAYDVALLAPNVERETDSRGRPLIDFLIDPDDPSYRWLYPLLKTRQVISFPPGLMAPFRPRFEAVLSGSLSCAEAAALTRDVLAALNPQPEPSLPWDARVQQATAFMRARIPESIPGVAEIASRIGLSESRFSHLFRAQLGLPVRQYLLWLRIRHAMRLWAQGKSLSEMALGAGFYDHAHFTRTLRRMTDYAPSMLTDPRTVIRKLCERGGIGAE